MFHVRAGGNSETMGYVFIILIVVLTEASNIYGLLCGNTRNKIQRKFQNIICNDL